MVDKMLSSRRNFILVTCILLAAVTLTHCSFVIEAGELGRIRGFTLVTSNRTDTSFTGRTYYQFSGIPFATAASYLGINRFKPSKLREGSLSYPPLFPTFRAMNPLVICPQTSLLAAITPTLNKIYSPLLPPELQNTAKPVLGRENCLKLHISTPKVRQQLNPPDLSLLKTVAASKSYRTETLRKGVSLTNEVAVVEPDKLLPVIVYVHGGSFTGVWGSLFNGGRLMERDVVLVTINYRLGVLGFFNMETNEAPGNAGLYDVITALQWVQKYIEFFGGDKTRVTIAGQSAGAAAVTHMLVSPLGEGLFHRVIAGSGTALLEWATCEDPLPESMKIATIVGCNIEGYRRDEIVSCVRAKPVRDLVAAMNNYTSSERKEARLGFWAGSPSVQKSENITIPKILPESPIDVMRAGKQKNVPLMMGTTLHDGSAVLDTAKTDFLEANDLLDDPFYIQNQLLNDLMKVLGLMDRSAAMIESVGLTYMGYAHYSDKLEDKYQGLIDIFSVFFFKAMAFQTIELHSQLSSDSYWYSFDYQGFWSLFGLISIGGPFPVGVSHADDLLFLFQFLPFFGKTSLDVSNRYIDYHVNFAYYGNPNGGAGEAQTWPKFNISTGHFLKIDSVDTATQHYKRGWANASEILYKEPAPTTPPSTTTTTLAQPLTSSSTTESGTSTTTTGKTETTTSSCDSQHISVFLVAFVIVINSIVTLSSPQHLTK